MSDNVFAILIAAGGATAVCAAVFAALWKLTIDATIERFKRSQSEALEEFKSDLEASAARASRFEEAQFGAFQEIWEALADLRVAADRLWDRATRQRVDEFGRRLEAAQTALYGNQLVIDTRHLLGLRDAIGDFEQFYRGKEGLLELRATNPANLAAIEARIEENGRLREHYSTILDDLRGAIRRDIRPGHGLNRKGM
ncbi:MAG: hypothetical protein JWM41_4072 [Gemmatimonadetes bacterium]|nr:hypothetical protein [Gemmatimonadota bacterium]